MELKLEFFFLKKARGWKLVNIFRLQDFNIKSFSVSWSNFCNTKVCIINETVKKLVLIDDTFMYKMHFRQPEFVYGECRPLLKFIKWYRSLNKLAILEMCIEIYWIMHALRIVLHITKKNLRRTVYPEITYWKIIRYQWSKFRWILKKIKFNGSEFLRKIEEKKRENKSKNSANIEISLMYN